MGTQTDEEAFKSEENKPILSDIKKSSMQILSELFGTFDAEPPVIVKKEKKEKSESTSKKLKKSKKKHKHKDKKHKKKSKKKKHSSGSSTSSSSGEESEIDLARILIKQEKDKAEKKIKIEGTSLSLDIPVLFPDIKNKIKKEEQKRKTEANGKVKPEIKHIKRSHSLDKSENEEGELNDSETDSKRKKKHKHKEKAKRSRSRSKEKRLKYDDLRLKIKKDNLSPDRGRHSREKDSFRSRERSKERFRDRSFRDKFREEMDYEYGNRSRHRERDDGFYRSRDRSRDREYRETNKDDKWFLRDRYRGSSRDRLSDKRPERSRNRESSSSRFDKKKLLEIARRNAIQMMKSGSLPGALSLGSKAQEKMIAAIKSGGKTIEELTDFCKSLSKKEELGELSSMSEKEDSDADEPFHHPFQIKDRPTTITMNIKNSVPLPTKTTQERTTELRMQFPVSSGQQHRVNEEWVPVSPPSSKKTVVEVPKPTLSVTQTVSPLPIAAPPVEVPVPLPVEPAPSLIPAPPNAPPGPQVFPSVIVSESTQASVDIGSVVSQRLTAIRKLQENPHDVQALTEMYKSNKEMQSWAKSKQTTASNLGQFTGSTGAQILSQAELASGYQAWAKKDQLQTAAPVSGGMGMHLLQKMGWKPGEGLGKEKSGALEPLLLEVKLDKKGLVADEEQTKGKKKGKGGSVAAQTVKTLQGKHPVSLLGEYASKRKLGAPQYILEFECGPDHKKNFLFKVILNGVEYKPNIASANKKEAKANAATIALKQIGLLP